MQILARTLSLRAFPVEVTEHTLSLCHPYDVAAFSQTCRFASSLVYAAKDQHLWRQLLLSYPFDDPRKSTHALSNPDYSANLDWRAELQRRLAAERIAFGGERRADERSHALETFIYVVQNALPITTAYEPEHSFNILWVDNVLRESRLLDSPGQCTEMSLRAKLSSYLSLSLSSPRGSDTTSLLDLSHIRMKSRCFVYDLRNYRPDSMYGPYKRGGEGIINWIHVEGIINVIWTNLIELPLWIDTRPKVGLEATRAYSAPGTAPGSVGRKEEDWAGVEGTWRRYVCFMDYRDLFAFNYSSLSNGPRHPSFFEDELFQEATRLIELQLHVVDSSVSSIHLFPPPGAAFDSNYPPLYFKGTSKGVNGNEAAVEGCVRMGEDGVARWQFASLYGGQSQWSSEGVQIGNVASAAGIVGAWTGARHEHGDPVGPFWLWKVADGYPTQVK